MTAMMKKTYQTPTTVCVIVHGCGRLLEYSMKVIDNGEKVEDASEILSRRRRRRHWDDEEEEYEE
jgi:hypothetical protein